VKCDAHSHELYSNPFAYKVHQKQTSEYQQLINKSINARLAAVPYSAQRRVLDRDGLGITIDARTYYNLVRNTRGNKDKDSTISGLLVALDKAGFIYRTRVEEFFDDSGTITGRKLLQLWFIHREAVRFAQRFCAGKLLVVDGTFNTNELRLPLLTSVGVTNTGKTFPVALSYCPGETAASYNFFFESLRSEVFTDGVADPGVIMGDQAAGLISSMDTHDSMPNSRLQFCIWHAAEAMKTRWRKNGYSSTQIDGTDDEPGLADLTWQYLKSPTLTDLATNRERLLAALKPAEVKYVQQNWVPKEDRVIAAYTRAYPNLGATATQRGESYHPVLRQTTNALLPLEESMQRLVQKLNQVFRDLATDEDSSRTKAAGALDVKVFKSLIGNVTSFAIDKLHNEWKVITDHIAVTNEDTLARSPSCDCEILHRYSLPCKHFLLRVAQRGSPIPRSLLHPRWWLNGPVIRRGYEGEQSWKPQYMEEIEEELTLVISPRRKDVYRVMADVFEQRENLNTEERSRFDDQIMTTGERLNQAAKQHQHLASLPIGQPDPIPKRTWRKRDAHGKADRRGLTAAEIAEQDLKSRERQKKKQRPATPEYAQEAAVAEAQIPATPEQEPSATLANEEDKGRGKRKRKLTEAYREALEEGLL